MCLSNVYEKSPDANNLLLRNIADVRFEGDALVLTDIMGITRRLEAKEALANLRPIYERYRELGGHEPRQCRVCL